MKKIVALIMAIVFSSLLVVGCSTNVERKDIKYVNLSVRSEAPRSFYLYEVVDSDKTQGTLTKGMAYSYEKKKPNDAILLYVGGKQHEFYVKSCIESYEVKVQETSSTFVITYWYFDGSVAIECLISNEYEDQITRPTGTHVIEVVKENVLYIEYYS